MSKISLEPNDSGAGTFSIVSPDSNTNRTLTLPDEAGKLLSTGNDNPAEVFKQSNILGTVSESGGVPTGGIIERDSNANGEYVKYADGTMIVWQFRTHDTVPELGDITYVRTFPAAFAVEWPSGWHAGTDTRVNYRVNGFDANRSLTEITLTSRTMTDSANRRHRSHYFAIGRWY